VFALAVATRRALSLDAGISKRINAAFYEGVSQKRSLIGKAQRCGHKAAHKTVIRSRASIMKNLGIKNTSVNWVDEPADCHYE